MRTQIRYQKEIEKLENQNKELKKQLLLRGNPSEKSRKIKKSLIDMYSEVLDELSGMFKNMKIIFYVKMTPIIRFSNSWQILEIKECVLSRKES